MPRTYVAYGDTAEIIGSVLNTRRYDPNTETYYWSETLVTDEALDSMVQLIEELGERMAALEARLNALDPAWDL
jgi:hypothetical protein